MTNERAHYVMIGGFLGAGKTTALGRFARWATDRGSRVGLITNDQSTGLVDTAILRHQGFTVEEIAGGCFCCRFRTLEDAVEKLTDATRPDVFLAEPVGSCTDLVATVSYPLRRIYGDRYRIAPLSVLVDPTRAARVLGLVEGRSFSEKVVYVYKKQLEEAELIVVNKMETIDGELHARLLAALTREFPRAEVLSISAKEGTGLEAWFERIFEAEATARPAMDVDYVEYAEGEALLGWLNATVDLAGGGPFDANALLAAMTGTIRDALRARDIEVAHLKLTLDSPSAGGQLAVVSLVGSDDEPDVRESLLDAVDGGNLVVNLRAEGDPEVLKAVTEAALTSSLAAAPGLRASIEHLEHFRPAPPVPVHRDVEPTAEGAR